MSCRGLVLHRTEGERSRTVLQRSAVGRPAPGSVQRSDRPAGPKLSGAPPARPAGPEDCGRRPPSPAPTHTHRLHHQEPEPRHPDGETLLTPTSLTLSRASCPDRVASIRSASWFSLWSSTPCSKRRFLLALSWSSWAQSALSSSRVRWMSTPPVLPLAGPFRRETPSFSMSFNLSRNMET